MQWFWSGKSRWHSLFRRTFDRLSLIVLHLPSKFDAPLPPRLRKTLRATVIFGLSTALHLILMHRLPISETHHHPAFFDHSITMFFLSQPLALLVERTIVVPFSGGNVWVTRCWAWAWLLYSGRWWADVWVRRGLWDQREKVVGYSLIRGLWNGNWIPWRNNHLSVFSQFYRLSLYPSSFYNQTTSLLYVYILGLFLEIMHYLCSPLIDILSHGMLTMRGYRSPIRELSCSTPGQLRIYDQ